MSLGRFKSRPQPDKLRIPLFVGILSSRGAVSRNSRSMSWLSLQRDLTVLGFILRPAALMRTSGWRIWCLLGATFLASWLDVVDLRAGLPGLSFRAGRRLERLGSIETQAFEYYGRGSCCKEIKRLPGEPASHNYGLL